MTEPPLPSLRPLDVSVVQNGGQPHFLLQDMEGVAEQSVLLSPPAYFIAANLDGRSGASAIAKAFAAQFGARPRLEEIEKIVGFLDENHFLESPRFRERLAALKARFAALKSRPAAHAGGGYAGAEEALALQLDGYFKDPGPGLPGPGESDGPLAGLVSPHIDFPRGGAAYAWAYKEVLRRGLADLYVVLGVAHAGPAVPFILGLKDYETPFGPARLDRGLAEALLREAPELAEHEFAHRREHSVEFQAVWLKYAARRLGGDFKILPLLCTPLAAASGEPTPQARRTLEALERLLRAYPGKVCVLAGADFAHVGPRFGDSEPVPQLLDWMEREDRKSIEALLALDAPAFHRSAVADGGKRKVCGLGCLYAAAWLIKRLAPQVRGRLLRYGHAADPAGGEVSFASLAFSG